MTSPTGGCVALANLLIAACVCALTASCSRQVAPQQERAGATGSVSAAPAPPLRSVIQAAPSTAIQDIRHRYSDVRRRVSSFREIKRDLPGFSAEGGMLQAFFDGQALPLVQATFYGETGRADREFYYDASDHPYFVFEVETRYDAPLGAATRKQEYRYYFQDGRLIRLLVGDRQVSPDDAAYAARVTNVVNLSPRLVEAARQK